MLLLVMILLLLCMGNARAAPVHSTVAVLVLAGKNMPADQLRDLTTRLTEEMGRIDNRIFRVNTAVPLDHPGSLDSDIYVRGLLSRIGSRGLVVGRVNRVGGVHDMMIVLAERESWTVKRIAREIRSTHGYPYLLNQVMPVRRAVSCWTPRCNTRTANGSTDAICQTTSKTELQACTRSRSTEGGTEACARETINTQSQVVNLCRSGSEA
jgi:hypothetical protein